MHGRSIEFGKKYNVKIHVRSASDDVVGTMIVKETPQMEGIAVSGATIQKDMAKISLVGVDNKPGNAAKVFRCLAGAKVIVNDIMQTEVSADKANLAFTIGASDLRSAKDAMESLRGEVKYDSVFVREDIAEVSAVGVGMRSHYGIADVQRAGQGQSQYRLDYDKRNTHKRRGGQGPGRKGADCHLRCVRA
jgi:aspartate kinase